jgi:hypothetical protein
MELCKYRVVIIVIVITVVIKAPDTNIEYYTYSIRALITDNSFKKPSCNRRYKDNSKKKIVPSLPGNLYSVDSYRFAT